MTKELLSKLDGLVLKLDGIEKISKDQNDEIKDLKRMLQELYKDNYQKKQTIDKYKESCKEVNI